MTCALRHCILHPSIWWDRIVLGRNLYRPRCWPPLAYILQHIERARVLPIFSRYTNYHFTSLHRDRTSYSITAHGMSDVRLKTSLTEMPHGKLMAITHDVSMSFCPYRISMGFPWNCHGKPCKNIPRVFHGFRNGLAMENSRNIFTGLAMEIM